MLYLRWLETSRLHAGRTAVFEGDRRTTFAELAAAVSAAPPCFAPVVARSGGIGFLVEILCAWRDGQAVIPVEKDAPEPALLTPTPPGICLVKHTPGAIGIPRGIYFNDDQVAADGDRLATAMELSPDTPNLCVISPAHSYGFSNIVLPLVLHGVPVEFAAVPFPRFIEEIFARHPALVVPAVPSIWRAWHRAGILKGAPVKLALSAGAPLSLDLENEVFATSGLKLHNFYGASECGGISLDLTEEPRTFGDDLGTPLPGVNVSIGRDGRLRVKSNSVATAYETQRADDLLENGVYLTHDLGELDSNGRIRLTGTIGKAINVSGRKVSPGKVEKTLLTTGLVMAATVRGVPSSDPERFEEISARVVLSPGAGLDAVKTAAAARLQAWELPRHWHCCSPEDRPQHPANDAEDEKNDPQKNPDRQ